jgi:hypothetical protein
MLKNILVVTTLAVSGLVLTSCGDNRKELVKQFHAEKQKGKSVKINLPQEIIIEQKNKAILPSDSILYFEERLIDVQKAMKIVEESNERYSKELKTETHGVLREMYTGYLEDNKKYILEYKELEDTYSIQLNKYRNLNPNTVLGYTFDATIVTSILLKDTSIEVTNSYTMNTEQTAIIDAKTKDS